MCRRGTHDPTTDQCYLHLFLAEQPDLNWANPEVEAAMHDTLRFWLDRGVDGFRADVVHLIGKGTDVDDLPEAAAGLPILTVDRPEGHERLRRIRRLLDSYAHEADDGSGEVYLLGPGQDRPPYLGGTEPGTEELHLSFDFPPRLRRVDGGRTPSGDRRRSAGLRVAPLADVGALQPRPTTAPDAVRDRGAGPGGRRHLIDDAGDTLSLRGRGTRLDRCGEVASERQVDPAGRDGCRAPIPWDGDGSTDRGHGWPVAPWLPFPTNASSHAADGQVDDPKSILSLYRRLLALRRDRPALRQGEFELEPLDGSVLRWTRALGDERYTVLVNVSDAPAPWPDGLTGELVISSASDPTHGQLAPDEAAVVEA